LYEFSGFPFWDGPFSRVLGGRERRSKNARAVRPLRNVLYLAGGELDIEVSIHCASLWLRNPEKQLDQLTLHRSLLGITSTIDSLLNRHRVPHPAGSGQLDIQRIGSALAAMDPERETSVLVGVIKTTGKVILLSNELLQALESQGELQP
jgi:hypothetical protein